MDAKPQRPHDHTPLRRAVKEIEFCPHCGQRLDYTLTARQTETLQLLAQGFTTHEIAERMTTAEGTIKAHITAIFTALHVDNRVQAVLAAQRLGFVDQEKVEP